MVEKEPQVLMDAEAFYKTACKLRDSMVTNGGPRLTIPYISTYSWNHVEKTLEFIFMDTDIELRVYIYEKARTKWQKKALETESKHIDTRKKRPTLEAVIIKGDGKSNAELVRSTRNDVNLEEVNVELSKPKKDKPLLNAGSFRPILLNAAGKLLEYMVLERLLEGVDSTISERQYGFRRGKSTLNAISHMLNLAKNAAVVVNRKMQQRERKSKRIFSG
nr:unnamed protein product [Callosobruchus analis]